MKELDSLRFSSAACERCRSECHERLRGGTCGVVRQDEYGLRAVHTGSQQRQSHDLVFCFSFCNHQSYNQCLLLLCVVRWNIQLLSDYILIAFVLGVSLLHHVHFVSLIRLYLNVCVFNTHFGYMYMMHEIHFLCTENSLCIAPVCLYGVSCAWRRCSWTRVVSVTSHL